MTRGMAFTILLDINGGYYSDQMKLQAIRRVMNDTDNIPKKFMADMIRWLLGQIGK